jgi:hypothetical protein
MIEIVVNMNKKKYETDTVCDIFSKSISLFGIRLEPEPKPHLFAAPLPK